MPFPPRIQYSGAWHHVTNRGADRQDIFRDRADRECFIELLERSAARYKLEVHAFCLMGNHYHLLARTPELTLDRAMQYQSSVYTRWFNRRHRRDGPLFRGRYHSKLIEDDAHLLGTSRYIHRNPLELGVTDLERYAWSSYSVYTGSRRRYPWIVTADTLAILGGNRSSYVAVVESPLRTDVDVQLGEADDLDIAA